MRDHTHILRNAGILLVLTPLTPALIYYLCLDLIIPPPANGCGTGEILLLITIPFACVGYNLCGIICSMIFFRRIRLALASAAVFNVHLVLSFYLTVSSYDYIGGVSDSNFDGFLLIVIVITNVTSFLLYLGIATFDNKYMKKTFEKLLATNNDVMLDNINKMGASNVAFYLKKCKRKEPALYSSVVAKFEEAKVGFLFEAGSNANIPTSPPP